MYIITSFTPKIDSLKVQRNHKSYHIMNALKNKTKTNLILNYAKTYTLLQRYHQSCTSVCATTKTTTETNNNTQSQNSEYTFMVNKNNSINNNYLINQDMANEAKMGTPNPQQGAIINNNNKCSNVNYNSSNNSSNNNNNANCENRENDNDNDNMKQIHALLNKTMSRNSTSEKVTTDLLIRQLQLIQPHKPSYKVIHIAGTKGKGSVSCMIAEILRLAGYKVGLFTSPHLVDVRERMTVNHQFIPSKTFLEYISHVWDTLANNNNNNNNNNNTMKQKEQFYFPTDFMKDTMPRYFKFLTLTALYAFEQQKCDVVVMECGVGGLEDATNAIKYAWGESWYVCMYKSQLIVTTRLLCSLQIPVHLSRL